LVAELDVSAHSAARDIKTILVAPGQLGTKLFEGIQTPSNFLAPVVEPVELARVIVKMIEAGQSGQIRLPMYANWIPALAGWPVGIQKLARQLSRMDLTMVNQRKKVGTSEGLKSL